METIKHTEPTVDGSDDQPAAEIYDFSSARLIRMDELDAETERLTRFRKSVPGGEVGARVWLKEHKKGVAAVGSAAAVAAALGALGLGAHMVKKHRQNKP